jgi:hypothetical protein
VKSPEGETAAKTLTLSLVRVSGAVAGQPREGRWIITKIDGA